VFCHGGIMLFLVVFTTKYKYTYIHIGIMKGANKTQPKQAGNKNKHFNELNKPRVFRAKGFLYVIYKDKTEVYKLEYGYTHKQFSKENGYEINKDSEVEITKNSSGREIHYTTEEEIKEAWDNILKEK
jgi:hypothetical protein